MLKAKTAILGIILISSHAFGEEIFKPLENGTGPIRRLPGKSAKKTSKASRAFETEDADTESDEDATPKQVIKKDVVHRKTKSTTENSDTPDATTESSGDTYNFYFQKSPQASDVKQGKTQNIKPLEKKAQPEENSEPEPEGVPVKEVPVRETLGVRPRPYINNDSRFDLHLGAFYVLGKTGAGYSAGTQFNFSETFGAQLNLLSFAYGSTAIGQTFSAFGAASTTRSGRSSGADVALTYAPIIQPAEYETLRVQGLLGVIFLADSLSETTVTVGAGGATESNTSKENLVLPYVGIDAGWAFVRGLGLSGYAKLTSQISYSQIGVNLIWHL